MEEGVLTKANYVALWTLLGTEAQSALLELRWMIVGMIVLTLADFYWGTREALMRHESWHFSRAGRRTAMKIVEYMTYLLIGCVVGFSITEPLGMASHITASAIGLGFGMVFDLNSIIGHVLHVKGIKTEFNLWLFLLGLLKHHKEDVAESIDGAIQEEKQ